ncbi:aspartate aminotransferase family protein [Bosea sp. (in: a-proteobacteria)]|uniref:aspartate aminotransferase family protein n=1 Tax=Bosea sp. (in: a-proteobacteria) TaxID=1871050 RepID=UPI002622D264|nr:aspartate aminotransferase family protein [Bosea sp. (in: a-proteobacteria)]MCO5090042.1 aspartate aminotransferase family protein [Bosea sp. (in: a-proteobacteria)]
MSNTDKIAGAPAMAERRNSELQEDQSFLIPNTKMLPIITRGEGAVVEDDYGRSYIDLEAGPGVVSVGHCHPKVVSAIREQAGKLLQGPGSFHSKLSLDLACRLSSLTRDHNRRVFFTNSGAESNDGAIKLAVKDAWRRGKQGFGVIALEYGFHGRLSLPLSLTGIANRKKGFSPYLTFPSVIHVPAPYFYRNPFRCDNESEFAKICVSQIEEAMKTRAPGEFAIMIAEPILAVGGVIVPPVDYWPRVRELCDKYGITLIFDEVFTGFGRTGRTFAHQHSDIQADAVTFAKAVGGGVPLGGFMATEALGTAFEDADHFTTFGSNNHIGLAAGMAVLDILEQEKLAERARVLGDRLVGGLKELQRAVNGGRIPGQRGGVKAGHWR